MRQPFVERMARPDARSRVGHRVIRKDGEAGRTGVTVPQFADIVAVAGNVLEDIRTTERPMLVMKQGALMRGGDWAPRRWAER